jgi:hypothetical protein
VGRRTSTHISAAFNHSTPTVVEAAGVPPPLPPPRPLPGACATMAGMEPYSPKFESASYSKTSRLYRRYGSAEISEVALAGSGPAVGRREAGAARSGRPNRAAPGAKSRSKATACGPLVRASVWPFQVSAHVSFSEGPGRSGCTSKKPPPLKVMAAPGSEAEDGGPPGPRCRLRAKGE